MKVISLLKNIGDGVYVKIENTVGEQQTFDTAGGILKLRVSDMLHSTVHVILPESYPEVGGKQGITIIAGDD